MAPKRHARHHLHRRSSSLSFAATTAITVLLLSSVAALSLNSPDHHLSGAVGEEIKGGGGGGREGEVMKGILSRRSLIGPGSSPPTCRSKCGSCAPCKPVHVPIQPGLSIPLEYYPEAWRCKCGNKLFMP